jgi:hypothetical protein
MPDLASTFRDRDPEALKILAELWGLELDLERKSNPSEVLAQVCTQTDLLREILESQPSSAKQALQALTQAGGHMLWAQFCREYGELRNIGPGRRERIKPHLQPISTTEWLWYRGLIGRAFLEQKPEPAECAYLPNEIFDFLKLQSNFSHKSIMNYVTIDAEPADIQIADDLILDHSCSILAALRSSLPLEKCGLDKQYLAIQTNLLITAGFINSDEKINIEAARAFLEDSRANALRQLVCAWMDSHHFNELRSVPELICEGNWKNDAHATRLIFVEWLKDLPTNQWCNLDSFIKYVHQNQPDFQRTAGDYDAWFIRDRTSGALINGFENWNLVEGRLLRFVFGELLPWLGLLDIGKSSADAPPTSMRKSAWAAALLGRQAPAGIQEENEKITVRSNGQVIVPRMAKRSTRYQIARFCDWRYSKNESTYHYFITSLSLQRARQQGLKIRQFIRLLQTNSKSLLPHTLLNALQRWEKSPNQVRLEKGIMLWVEDANILDLLEKSRAKRFLLRRITPTMMLIKPGGEEIVQQALTELGYLSLDSNSL